MDGAAALAVLPLEAALNNIATGPNAQPKDEYDGESEGDPVAAADDEEYFDLGSAHASDVDIQMLHGFRSWRPNLRLEPAMASEDDHEASLVERARQARIHVKPSSKTEHYDPTKLSWPAWPNRSNLDGW